MLPQFLNHKGTKRFPAVESEKWLNTTKCVSNHLKIRFYRDPISEDSSVINNLNVIKLKIHNYVL